MTGRCPALGHAAARAALRYGVAQGWLLDETTRRSVIIQEAVERVAHTGQREAALHTRGRYGGPAEWIVVEPTETVLVLAGDMDQGVLHASRVRRARPQWTIQVYTPPRAWPFSTWAMLAVMWHLTPGDAPTGTAEKIARDLHAWPADQDFPWRRPQGSLPVAPAAEGFSLAATLQRHPDKRARHLLQTGTAPAAPPDSEWRWDWGGAQPLPDSWILRLWYLPTGTLAHAAQAVKGDFPPPQPPGVVLLRSLHAGAAWIRWREEDGRPSPYFPLVQGQALLHAEVMGTMEWGAIVPDTACRWITAPAPQPMQSPPACYRLLRAVPPLARRPALPGEVWRAMLSHPRQWMMKPGARYPPGTGLEQLTPPTPGVRHTLHRASALTEQLSDEVLDLALEPLRVLYPQTHILPAGTSNRLGRLGLQRRVEAAHAGGVVEQWLTLNNPSTTQGHWYLHQLSFFPPDGPGAPPAEPVPHAPGAPGRAELPAASPACPPAGAAPGGAAAGPPAQHGHHGAAKGKQQRGQSRAGPHDLRGGGLDGGLQAPCPGHLGNEAIQASGPHSTGVHVLGRHHGTRGGMVSATAARRSLQGHAAPPAGRNAHADGTPCGGATDRRRGEFCPPPRPGADCWEHTRAAARRAPPLARHTPRAHPRHGRGWRHTPSQASAGGSTVCCRQRATRPSCTATPEGTGRTSWPGAAGPSGTAPRDRGIPAPCQLPAGAHPGLLYDGRPLAASRPATEAQRPQQEAGTRVGQPPHADLEPRPGGASTGRMARRRHQDHGRSGPPRGASHAPCPAATLPVAQRGQQNPQWVVCMFSPADAHIAICDFERLPGPEAVIRVAHCAGMIVKALREGEHYALLLQVRVKDNTKAANPGVWPAAARLADLELQLAVLTTVYHWLQAFNDLRWRGKPDRQISATHWQEWLQADAQRDAVQGLGPAPATQALDAAAPGRALAPHTVPLAKLPLDPAPEGAIRKSLPLPPGGGQRSQKNAPYVQTRTTQVGR